MADKPKVVDTGVAHDRSGGDKEVARRREERLTQGLFGKIIKPGRGEVDSRDLPPPQTTDRE